MQSRTTTSTVAATATTIAMILLLSACGPTRVSGRVEIPTPLIDRMPVNVALHVPKEFSEYDHKESRKVSGKWDFPIGKVQTESITKVVNAMFERVATVDSVENAAAADPSIRMVLEPQVDDYSFVTPQDAGGPFFAVSVKYRMSIYTPDGKLADSWAFTGYGTAISKGVDSSGPLEDATALAIRDACAKLATEFRSQDVVKELLGTAAPSQPAAPSTPAPAEKSPAEKPDAPSAPKAAPGAAPPPSSTLPPDSKGTPTSSP
jgi:hypothetical protein